jgi:hypothetical protein
VEILEPETEWKYDAQELFKKNTHGLPMDAIQSMLQRLEPYSVNDALKAVSPQTSLSDKDRKKVDRSLAALEEEDTEAKDQEDSQNPSSAFVRIEVTKNNGQKGMFKPILVKSAEY